MKIEHVFPVVLIVLNIAAAIAYAFKHNWTMFIYWIAAATLTVCVTFGKG
jgi:hypothetical protein